MGSVPKFLTVDIFQEWLDRGSRSLKHHGKPTTYAYVLANRLRDAWLDDAPKADAYRVYLDLLYDSFLDESGECTNWWKIENMFWSFAVRYEPSDVPADEAEILIMAQDQELDEWGLPV